MSAVLYGGGQVQLHCVKQNLGYIPLSKRPYPTQNPLSKEGLLDKSLPANKGTCPKLGSQARLLRRKNRTTAIYHITYTITFLSKNDRKGIHTQVQ